MSHISKALKTLVAVTVLALLAQFSAGEAAAQATRTWISGVGDDANPCSRTAPCKTFAGAIGKTAAAGEINTLDPGGFGTVTIVKSMSMVARGNMGGIAASGTNGINISAGATDTVILDGLNINGNGTGLNGIRVLSAGRVVVRNCSITGFTVAGIAVNSSNQVHVSIEQTFINNSKKGVTVTSTSPWNIVDITNSTIIDNVDAGVLANGAPTKITVGRSTIAGTAVAFSSVSSGKIYSHGDNAISAPSVGTITGVVALQ